MRRFCAILLTVVLCCAAYAVFHNAEEVNDTPSESGIIRYKDGSGDYLFIKNPALCGPDGEVWDMFKNGVYYKTAYGVTWEEEP